MVDLSKRPADARQDSQRHDEPARQELDSAIQMVLANALVKQQRLLSLPSLHSAELSAKRAVSKLDPSRFDQVAVSMRDLADRINNFVDSTPNVWAHLRQTSDIDIARDVLRKVDDREFFEIVLEELLLRPAYEGVVGQFHAAMRAIQLQDDDLMRVLADPAATGRRMAVADAAHGAVLRVPHVGSTEAGQILTERGVLATTNPSDSLRRFAHDGRLIGLREGRKWVYPRFQLDNFDPRDPDNIIVAINRLLDAGRYPESATSWWTSPAGSLPDHLTPAELLGDDEETLRQLARTYAAGPDL